MPFCIGISAIFESSRTVHARTFLMAVNHFINHHDTHGLTFRFEDDDASYDGGRRAAQRLLDQGAQVIVGHFSSDAAMGALPLYRAVGVPVLLPAATKQDLLGMEPHAFRLCPSDTGLVTLLARRIRDDIPGARLLVAHDSTDHGESLARALISTLAGSNVRLTLTLEQADAVVYCGRLNNSIRYVNTLLNRRRDLRIYLTDDALSSWFIQNTPPSDTLRIVGLATVDPSQALYETYYLESLAAMQIATTLIHCQDRLDTLRTTLFTTVLGDVRFCDGENRYARAALWKIRNQRFVPSTSA